MWDGDLEQTLNGSNCGDKKSVMQRSGEGMWMKKSKRGKKEEWRPGTVKFLASAVSDNVPSMALRNESNELIKKTFNL